MIITVFDARRIQTYLFGSNRLSDNIGASYLVNQALNEWPLEAALLAAPDCVNPEGKGQPIKYPSILDSEKYAIELLYSAGGKALYICRDIRIAKIFSSIYSRILLTNAPGLEVACHHHEIPESSPYIGVEIWKALRGIAETKAGQLPSTPNTGSGVTERCASGNEETAVEIDYARNKRLIGPSVYAKAANLDNSRDHLRAFFKERIPEGCRLPLELDHLGRSEGVKSFIGVVHIDGNDVGRSMQKLLRYDRFASTADCLEAVRKHSDGIARSGACAIHAVMDQVGRNWGSEDQTLPRRLGLKTVGNSTFLPFRPLVYGGDDITFVCDGRIALDLAATCLKAFNNASRDLHACAGVAMVKSRYPFFRAYQLAEDLCHYAKQKVKTKNPPGGSAMDWHVLSGGPQRSINEIRNREYTTDGSAKLTCRPYFVLPSVDRGMTDWQSFRNGLLRVLQADPTVSGGMKWANSHSRLKSLSAYVSEGPQKTGLVLDLWRRKGYAELPDYCSSVLSNGFFGDQTPLLDALELLDFHISLC